MPASDSSGSVSGRSSPEIIAGDKDALFMDSTISRDVTAGSAAKMQEFLVEFSQTLVNGLQLQQTRSELPDLSHYQPVPLPPIPGQPSSLGMQPPLIQPVVSQMPPPPTFGQKPAPPGPPAPFPPPTHPEGAKLWLEGRSSSWAEWRKKAMSRRDRFPLANGHGKNELRASQAVGTQEIGVSDDGESSNQDAGISPKSPTSKNGANGVLTSKAEAICNRQALDDVGRTAGREGVTSEIQPHRSPASDGDGSHSFAQEGDFLEGAHGARPANPPEAMSEALYAVGEKFLDIDILDQHRDISKFIAYLIDANEMLSRRISYLLANDGRKGNSIKNPEPVIDANIKADKPDEPELPRAQTLHRVFCTNSWHQHNKSLYEDQPKYRPGNDFSTDFRLMGDHVIHNIDDYLTRHPEICLVIFKEHNCNPSPARSKQLDMFVDKSAAAAERSERVRVVSPLLQKALTEVAEFEPFPAPASWARQNRRGRYDPAEEFSIEMDAPYVFFFHHRAKLATLSRDSTYTQVLTPLLEFLDINYKKEYDEAEDLFRDGLITASHLPKLFKPEHIVVDRTEPGVLEAHVLSGHPDLSSHEIAFRGWSWRYDGSELSRANWSQTIDMISDDKIPISQLKVHPVNFALDGDRKELEERGMRFWSLRGRKFACYTGWDAARQYYHSNSRFMVDMATHKLMHATRKGDNQLQNDVAKSKRWPLKIKNDETISRENAMLLPKTIFAFELEGKKWVNLLVDNFHEVQWNKKAFERLVLDPKVKDMIHALIEVQTTAAKMDDIITGKGNGLIILLHGSPGTGKTLTAESVAEIAEKPLYRVTCGDIGTYAEDVEKYLTTVLYLGKVWDCVLLLDEADVFLEERTMADLQRNSLVSVFLRTLEYYEGILILTSNRVGTFDEAFKSRIQVAIHYENLTKKSRKAIWRNFFDMIEDSADEEANMSELEGRLDRLAEQEMNGRQIRNALLTARQLAKHKKERLDWHHLSQVIDTSTQFNKYLKTVRGHSDEQWAREDGLR